VVEHDSQERQSLIGLAFTLHRFWIIGVRTIANLVSLQLSHTNHSTNTNTTTTTQHDKTD